MKPLESNLRADICIRIISGVNPIQDGHPKNAIPAVKKWLQHSDTYIRPMSSSFSQMHLWPSKGQLK